MRIGKVAAQAGVNVQTIRFYERKGLLKPPRRSVSSYRDYPVETVEVIQFIKRNQKYGFTLKEIRTLLKVLATPSPRVLDLRESCQERIRALDEQIRYLQAIRDDLSAKLDVCECRDGRTLCSGAKPVVEALTKH